MTLVTRTIALRDRVMLPYVEHGDAAGVPVILLHGASFVERIVRPRPS
jgi:hypothetical protein